MSRPGWFDPGLTPSSQFDPEVNPKGVYDHDFVSTGAAKQHVTASGSPAVSLSASVSSAADLIFNGNGTPSTSLVASGSSAAVEIFNASGAPTITLGAVGQGDADLIFNADGAAVTTITGFGSSIPAVAAKKKVRGQIRFVDQSEEREPVRGELAGLTDQTPELSPDLTGPVEEPPPPVIPAPLDIDPKAWKTIVAKTPGMAQPVQQGRSRRQIEDEELLVMLMASAA